VLLGEGRAKAVTQAMMIAYYAGVVALVAVRALPWPALLTGLALPLLVRTLGAYRRPRPAQPPPDYPIWPLWWAPLAFLHTRRAGGLLILGLAAWAIWAAIRG